jgi:hypothetical protein
MKIVKGIKFVFLLSAIVVSMAMSGIFFVDMTYKFYPRHPISEKRLSNSWFAAVIKDVDTNELLIHYCRSESCIFISYSHETGSIIRKEVDKKKLENELRRYSYNIPGRTPCYKGWLGEILSFSKRPCNKVWPDLSSHGQNYYFNTTWESETRQIVWLADEELGSDCKYIVESGVIIYVEEKSFNSDTFSLAIMLWVIFWSLLIKMYRKYFSRNKIRVIDL